MRGTISAAASALMCAFLLGACGPDPAPTEAPTRASAALPAAVGGSLSASDTASAPPDEAAGSSVLAVEGEGLRVFDPTSGSASPIAFGRPQAEVLAALERLRGEADRGVNADCGAGPVDYANWADGLSLVFQDGDFAGWGLDDRAAKTIGTASGVGPGSTRAELDAAYGDVEVSPTSLGDEFTTGGLSGVLDGPGAAAKITDMWAGLSCAAR